MYPSLTEDSRLSVELPSKPEKWKQLILSPEKIFFGKKISRQKICIKNNWNLPVKLNSSEGKFYSERWWQNCRNALGPQESATLLLLKNDIAELQKSGVLYLTSRYDTFPEQPITLMYSVPIQPISYIVSVKVKKIFRRVYSIHLKMQENLSVEYILKHTKDKISQWREVDFGGHQLTVVLKEKKGKIKFRTVYNGELFYWDYSFPENDV